MSSVENILIPILKRTNKQKTHIILCLLPQSLKNDVTVSAAFHKHNIITK